jgi:hypothetical protein
VFISNLTVSDTVFGNIGAATLTPSGTSGQFGWWKRNATAPQSGTVATATATDSVKAGVFQGSGSLLTAVPIGGTTGLQDSLTAKLNRAEFLIARMAYLQDSLTAKQNRGENYPIGAATGSSLTPSGTSGQFGWWKRNATAPESGTLSPATATDTVKAVTAIFTNLSLVKTTASAITYPLFLQNADGTNVGAGVGINFDTHTATDVTTGRIENVRDASGQYSMRFSSYLNPTALTEVIRISGTGKVGIWTTTFPSTGKKKLIFGSDSTAASGMNTSTAGIYADTVAGVMEMKGIDGAGNITTLTPHNFSMFSPPVEASLPWSFTSSNEYVGKEIAIDMWKLAQLVEQLTGQKLIYERDLADSLVKSWDVNQTYHYQLSVDQRQRENESYQTALADWNQKTKGMKSEDIDWSKEPKLVQSPVYVKTKPPQWLKSRLKIPSIL